MALGTTTLLLYALLVGLACALTPSTFLKAADKERLRTIFLAPMPYSDTDLTSIYYSTLGISLLGIAHGDPQRGCNALNKGVDKSSVESLFYASSAAINLQNGCKLTVDNVEATLNDAITTATATRTVYQAVATLSNLKAKIDSKKVQEVLKTILKVEDSPLSHGYAFYAASYLSGSLKYFFDLIEDVLAQADEIDDTYLQFDSGLYTTAVVIDSAYRLAETQKEKPAAFNDKAVKFANYLMERKHVGSLRDAALLLAAVRTLSDNQYHRPVVVTLASQVAVTDKYPTVQVRVCSLFGLDLGDLTVTADTARHSGDDAVVLSKQPFRLTGLDERLYELDFLKAKPAHGFYTISVSVVPKKADPRLLGTSGAEVKVKVTTHVNIEDMTLGVADHEQTVALKSIKLQQPNKAANMLEADNHQRVTMSFRLIDSHSAAIKPHQVFVRMINDKTKQEIIFVPEADSAANYKFDLDVGAKGKEFGHLSGKYSMDLIIGDAVIENSILWTLADVQLHFPDEPATAKPTRPSYAKKETIEHLFRVPDKRPSSVISNFFTVLVLIPFLVLFVLWFRIGVNISNFPLSISAVGFHAGVAAILCLYYMYWTRLDMFETLRYLALLAVPTFLCGNRLLSNMAAQRK